MHAYVCCGYVCARGSSCQVIAKICTSQTCSDRDCCRCCHGCGMAGPCIALIHAQNLVFDDTIYAHEIPSRPRIHAQGSALTRRALCMGALLVLLLGRGLCLVRLPRPRHTDTARCGSTSAYCAGDAACCKAQGPPVHVYWLLP